MPTLLEDSANWWRAPQFPSPLTSPSKPWRPQPIPLVLVLWEHPNYAGIKRVFFRGPALSTNSDGDQILIGGGGCANTSQCEFTDKASSAVVHPGPDYGDGRVRWLVDNSGTYTFLPFQLAQNWRAYLIGLELPFLRSVVPTYSLFADPNFFGASITLGAGAYPRLENYGFNDRITSVFPNTWRPITPGYGVGDEFQEVPIGQESAGGAGLPSPADPIAPIPLLLNFSVPDNYEIDFVEPSSYLESDFGSRFNNASGAVLTAETGPNYSGSEIAVAWTERDWQGIPRFSYPGSSTALRDSTSSISIATVPAALNSPLSESLMETTESQILASVRGAITPEKAASTLGVTASDVSLLAGIFVQGGLDTLRDCLSRGNPEYWHLVRTALQGLNQVIPRSSMVLGRTPLPRPEQSTRSKSAASETNRAFAMSTDGKPNRRKD